MTRDRSTMTTLLLLTILISTLTSWNIEAEARKTSSIWGIHTRRHARYEYNQLHQQRQSTSLPRSSFFTNNPASSSNHALRQQLEAALAIHGGGATTTQRGKANKILSDDNGDSDDDYDDDDDSDDDDSDDITDSEDETDTDDDDIETEVEDDDDFENNDDEQEESESEYEDEESEYDDEEQEDDHDTKLVHATKAKSQNHKSSSSQSIVEYVDPLVLSPLQDMGVTLGVMLLCNKLDLTNAKVIKIARYAFIAYIALAQLFLLYVRYRAKSIGDMTEITLTNPLSNLLQNQVADASGGGAAGGTGSMVKNLANSILSTSSTIMDYDLSQAKSMNNGLLLPMVMLWFLHFKMGQVQPLFFQTANGVKEFLFSPLFQIYVLGRNLERPFKNKKMEQMQEQMNGGDDEEEKKDVVTKDESDDDDSDDNDSDDDDSNSDSDDEFDSDEDTTDTDESEYDDSSDDE